LGFNGKERESHAETFAEFEDFAVFSAAEGQTLVAPFGFDWQKFIDPDWSSF